MKDFLRKHKARLILLSPVIIGLLFFIYSSISALITISTAEVPEEFEKASVVIKNYEISEINRLTNKLKWRLKAKRADLDQDQKQGKVHEVLITVYELGAEKFTIKADYALMDNKQKSIRLYDHAQLNSSDGLHELNAAEIHFDENHTDIEVRGNWQLQKNGKDSTVVTGDEGFVSKDFKAIRSKGHASLSAAKTKITADELLISKDKPISARGAAQAKLENGTVVNAAEILIYDSGEVKARGSVAVNTRRVSCYAAEMLVEAGADRKPKLARFKGNPYIVQDGRTIYADSIIYDFTTEQAVIEGNVRSQK